MGPRLGVELAVALALVGALLVFYVLNGKLETQLAQSQRTVAELRVKVAAQNTAIDNLTTAAELYAAHAAASARAALLAGERRRAALPAGHGPAVMNAWLRATFGTPDAPAP